MSIRLNNDLIAPLLWVSQALEVRTKQTDMAWPSWTSHSPWGIRPSVYRQAMQGMWGRDMCFERTGNVTMFVRQRLDTEVRDELEEE